MVIECVVSTGREHLISAEEADAVVTSFEDNAFDRNRYDVRRAWDAVSYTVSIVVKGQLRPVLAYTVPLND